MSLFKLKTISMVLFLFSFSNAYASIIYTFDVSDTSWATTSSDFTDTSIWFEFKDTADLNSLANSDLLSMGFDSNIGSNSFTTNIGQFNINDFFSISGGVASLTLGGPGSAAVWESSSLTPGGMQIGQGGSVSLIVNMGSGSSLSAHNSSSSFTYTSTSSVPEPTSSALFALGAMGLLAYRRRKISS